MFWPLVWRIGQSIIHEGQDQLKAPYSRIVIALSFQVAKNRENRYVRGYEEIWKSQEKRKIANIFLEFQITNYHVIFNSVEGWLLTFKIL